MAVQQAPKAGSKAPTSTSTKPSAKPGVKEEKAAKKAKRIAFPTPEGGIVGTDLVGYDPKVHLPLKRTAFKNEADFYDVQAARYEAAAKKMRSQAEVVRKTGGRKELVKVNRLKKMQEKMAELRAQLAAQGLDLASFGITENGEAAPAAEATDVAKNAAE